MAAYESDQEQIETLKKWWKENGVPILTGAALGLALLFGWRTWDNYTTVQAENASTFYQQILMNLEKGEIGKAREVANSLLSQHSNSSYASLGQLNLAMQDLKEGHQDAAHARLQWVIDKNQFPEIVHIARLRKAKLYLSEKKFPEAKSLLNVPTQGNFSPNYAELKGDTAVAEGQLETARSAYQLALETGKDSFSPDQKGWVQMKLDNLGPVQTQRVEGQAPVALEASTSKVPVSESTTSSPTTPPSTTAAPPTAAATSEPPISETSVDNSPVETLPVSPGASNASESVNSSANKPVDSAKPLDSTTIQVPIPSEISDSTAIVPVETAPTGTVSPNPEPNAASAETAANSEPSQVTSPPTIPEQQSVTPSYPENQTVGPNQVASPNNQPVPMGAQTIPVETQPPVSSVPESYPTQAIPMEAQPMPQGYPTQPVPMEAQPMPQGYPTQPVPMEAQPMPQGYPTQPIPMDYQSVPQGYLNQQPVPSTASQPDPNYSNGQPYPQEPVYPNAQPQSYPPDQGNQGTWPANSPPPSGYQQ